MSWSDILLYFGLPSIGLVAVAVGILLSPWGPAILNLVANSKIAQIGLVVLSGGLAVLMIRKQARQEGVRDGLKSVREANRKAVDSRRATDRKVDVLPDTEARKRLKEWE